MDVRPHPHVCLATVTYLFEGEIVHRDSLGYEQAIQPGAINLIVAGRGIVHSERSGAAFREHGGRMHGIQSWMALPRAEEEREPSFHHHPASTMPVVQRPGVTLRVLLGEAFGARAPVPTFLPTLYVDASLDSGAELDLPEHVAERAVYIVQGGMQLRGASYTAGELVVLPPGPARLTATEASRWMLLGGAPMDGERHIEWNFVASSAERIERAKDDWRSRRFPLIPGDSTERIPLPGDED
jgi:hypothetical protein